MDQQDLLKKYLEGKCSHEELAQLYTLLQEGKLSDYEYLIQDIWEELEYNSVLSVEKSKQVFSRIQSEIQENRVPTVPLYKRWPFYGAAAAIAMLLLAGIFFLNQTEMIEVRTTYQETRSVLLPDGTKVTLNANSTLRYSEDILSQSSREIWILGEAFFDVKSLQKDKADKVPFIVHTDVVDIWVLGTQFNVKDRHGKAEVVLTEGKIRLSHSQNPQKQLDMEPGQKALANSKSGLQISQVEDPALYASWQENELYFDNESLSSIAQELRDAYGVQIKFAQSSLGNLQFTGSAPADQLEVLFISIEKSFNLNIKKNEKTYVIETN